MERFLFENQKQSYIKSSDLKIPRGVHHVKIRIICE